MATERKLTGKDYFYWILTILGFFFLFLFVGYFGNLAYLTQSPITSYVDTLWRITYISGGAVFGVFMGSLVFLAVKFRETEEGGVTITTKSYNTLYYFTMALDIIALVVLTYEALTLQLTQFGIGLLGSMILLTFSSIIYLVYRMYFSR